jgi:uncharacterized protein (DUF952 family)
MKKIVYKICPETLWQDALEEGVFSGAPIDLQDGFIHFSTGAQATETASKHFAGQNDLLLIAIEEDILGDALKYEVSRNNDLFPHLYGTFSPDQVAWAKPLPLDVNGNHIFPEI